MELFYTNKGEQKPLEITDHARRRLKSRWFAIKDHFIDNSMSLPDLWQGEYAKMMESAQIDAYIGQLLQWGKRVKISDMSPKARERAKHYPPSIRLRICPFELVIEDGVLKTIEIYVKELRSLN